MAAPRGKQRRAVNYVTNVTNQVLPQATHSIVGRCVGACAHGARTAVSW